MVLPNTPIHAQWKLAEHLRERRLAAGLTQEGPAHMMKHQVKEIRVGLQFDQETMPDTPIQLPICKPWLQWVERLPIPKERKGQFPYSLPLVRKTKKLELHPDVTFLVGENG